jgi:hypothetical protein
LPKASFDLPDEGAARPALDVVGVVSVKPAFERGLFCHAENRPDAAQPSIMTPDNSILE